MKKTVSRPILKIFSKLKSNKLILKRMLAISILASMLFSLIISSNAYTVKMMKNVNNLMLNENFWIDKTKNANDTIMTPEEIAAFNKEMGVKIPSVIYDTYSLKDKYSKKAMLSNINRPLPTAKYYVDGKEIGKEYWDKIKEQLNVAAIQDVTDAKYGFVVKRTNLKVYPTADIISDAANDPGYDEFQNSGMLVNEPVQVVYQTLDSKWYYVYMYNCTGWVSAADVALCPDKETWVKNRNFKDFLVVTGNKIRLEPDPFDPATSEMEFSMGTVLQLAAENELPKSINERALFDNYVIKVPYRDANGMLDNKLCLLPLSRDVSVGFLPYTRANILRQAFKMHGDRYGWGGMLNSRDCSEFVMEVYRSFGFKFPRNTAGQEIVPCKKADLKGMSIKSKYKMLDNIAPGSSLHFNGHVMLYLGKSLGKYYVISDLGSFAEFAPGATKGTIVRTRSVIVNDLSVRRANGKQWVEELIYANQYEKSTFDDLNGYDQKAAVESLADSFIITGVDKNHFNPNDPMTRAEFSSVLAKALKLEENRAVAESKYKDVTDQLFAGCIGALAKEGYPEDAPDANFNPTATISRTDIKEIINRILAKKQTDVTKSDALKQLLTDITDVFTSGNGTDIGSANTKKTTSANDNLPCTRYESAVIVSKLLAQNKK